MRSSKTIPTSHLGFWSLVFFIFRRSTVKLPHLSRNHDVPYRGRLVCTLLISHVEVHGYIIHLGLVVGLRGESLPNFELLILPVGTFPIANELDFVECFNAMLTTD